MPENGYIVAEAAGYTALRSHFGASLEDHGPNVVLSGQVHRLPDTPEAYGAMITRAKAAPPQSRSVGLDFAPIVEWACTFPAIRLFRSVSSQTYLNPLLRASRVTRSA